MKQYVKHTLYAIIAALLLSGCARQSAPVDIAVNARSAVIMDARDGDILFKKNPDGRFPPASTAKVMTAIVAVEHLLLFEEVIPREGAVKVEPTVAGLRGGVAYKLEDLMEALLIKSANDAAVVIAEAVAGDEKKFAGLMNAKAAELGMKDTYFAKASGLPAGKKDSQYTTSDDLAKMMQYAMRYRFLLEMMSKKETTIRGSDGRAIRLKTHNKSLYSEPEALWGKTGYTREARRTFVGVDPSARPRIIVSLLRSDALWDDIATLRKEGLALYDEKYGNLFRRIFRWITGRKRAAREAVAY